MMGEFGRMVRLTLSLARHEILVQRKESILGLAWSVMWPLVQAGGFLLAFHLARGGASGGDALLLTYIGVLIWSTASAVLVSNLSILKSNREMITQVVFSFSILSVVDVTVKYIFFLVQFCVAMTLWLLLAPTDHWYLVLAYVLIYLVAFYLALLAMAWVASIVGVALPDLSFFLPPVLTLLLVLSPVFQRSVEAVPWAVRLLNEINPLSICVGLLYATIDVAQTGPTAPLLFLASAIVAVASAWYLVGACYREMAKVI